MKTFEIKNSSAISQIIVNVEDHIVGVAYTSNKDKLYEFYSDSPEFVEEQITTAIENNDSLGKLIHSLKKEGILEPFVSETE